MRNLGVFLVLVAAQVAYGHYQGPFLLWGVDNLSEMKIPTLQGEMLEKFVKKILKGRKIYLIMG